MSARPSRVAIVTGAARGIGAGVAAALAKDGYAVGLVGLEGDLLRQNAKAIGERAVAFEVDMTDRQAVGSAFEGVRERFGRIDVVVSNAGISNFDLLTTMSPTHFRRVMAVNVEGTFNAIQASIPHLVDTKGYFVGVASIAAALAPPGMAAYGASKGATENLLNTFRAEVVHKGVDVGVAYFGWLATDLVKSGGEHPAFTYVREHLPGPLKAIAPVDIAVRAIAEGVAKRKRRVLAPSWLRFALALRWFVAANPSAYKAQMPEIERLCAEELKKRGGPDGALITEPVRN
jgi:NAD(P)-dependent dehydrogenase (short-subunit alcohol dehydrogenase family)